ncbi:MAG: AEC family transporter [Clostridia bacterium]|nr:AEC family transporter [Clostridia bacterium]
MSSLIFALNAVAPIVLTVALGYILKKLNLMTAEFSKMANKLVFRVFLPAMLFLNVYKIEAAKNIEFTYIIYVFVCILVFFALAFPMATLCSDKRHRRGVLMQAAFRSNYALIGIPLAQSLFGDEGAAVATLLSALVIPLFNILAVICLSVYCEGKPDFKKITKDILKNPLIQSIALGGVFLLIRSILVKNGIDFRLTDIEPVYKVINYLSNVATPLCLLVLGAQFEFSTVAEIKKEIISGVLVRNLFVPLIGLGVAFLFFKNLFSGAHFAAFVAVFTSPLAVSSVAMAQEMKGDAQLAGQLVIWTTLFSALSTFTASLILKQIGIF